MSTAGSSVAMSHSEIGMLSRMAKNLASVRGKSARVRQMSECWRLTGMRRGVCGCR